MLEEELHFQLLRSFHFSNRAIVAQTSRLQLMPGQPKILLYLLEHDGAMAKEITEGCVLDKSTVTSLLARNGTAGADRPPSACARPARRHDLSYGKRACARRGGACHLSAQR